jgi:hypothetical protein
MLPLPVDSVRRPVWPAVDINLILLIALRGFACSIDHRRARLVLARQPLQAIFADVRIGTVRLPGSFLS